jgi:undecaprenyl-diphosphatase
MEIKQVRQLSLVLLIISTFFVIALAILVRYHNLLNLDVLLSRDFQSISKTASNQLYLYYLMTFVSTFGKLIPAAILVVFSALIFYFYRYYLQALFTLLTPIAAGINSIIKLIVNRPRPDESLVAVFDRQFDPSFPSGHVVFYVVFFGFMIIALRNADRIPKIIRYSKMIFAGLLIITIPFARVYLGAHWASDVLGGFLLGVILLSILLLIYFNEKGCGKQENS